MSDTEARYGWGAGFQKFHDTPSRAIRVHLQDFVHDASPEQVRAWDASIPQLQREVGEVLDHDEEAHRYTAILEYELPMESRRPDVIMLVRGAIVVLELKGKQSPSQADIDQAAGYARDLRCYHSECADRQVLGVLVPTLARGNLGERCGIHIVGPDALDEFIARLSKESAEPPVTAERFLAEDAYRPLPTLVKAARELFHRGDLTSIKRARASTDPAVNEIARIIHEAASTHSHRLILVTGVPGAGKTLVGLRVVHAHFIDDLAAPRAGGKPTVPAVFLSGNRPLVEVLQYVLKGAGGGGKTFVRGVLDYVKHYSGKRSRIPPEHVLVFDEAQRAFDAKQVQKKHKNTPGFEAGKSEPEHFIEFAGRVPDWGVVIGLIGGGQEIHVGEEGGLVQWRRAIDGSATPSKWQVHGPAQVRDCFAGGPVTFNENEALNLDTEIRFHATRDLHRFVARLLDGDDPAANALLAYSLERDSYHLRITRDLEKARSYLRERYADDPDARFGLVASSRDRDLQRFGVLNGFSATRNFSYGPWYGDQESAAGNRSCRHLADCITEFGAQGLELDAALLAWGTDLIWKGTSWSIEKAASYRERGRVKSPHQLRINAYRVLLTRGRDGVVLFVPELDEMDATYVHLVNSGFRLL